MSDPENPLEPPPPPPSSEDDFPEVRRRLWDLEWRLRRESGSVSDKLAEVLKLVFQAPAWTGEAVAEGMMPALTDMRRRIVALETKATEGTAPQHPAFVALADRVEILERLVEEGVAAQRAAMTTVDERLAGIELRVEAIETWGERIEGLESGMNEVVGHLEEVASLTDTVKDLMLSHDRTTEAIGARLEAHEGRIVSIAQGVEETGQRLGDACDRMDAEAERLTGETVERQEEAQALRELADATEASARELLGRIGRIEERGENWDLALEETAGDLVVRVGHLETAAERAGRELADKVAAAQFAGVSLSMATQQAAIKDIKSQIAAIRAGGQLPPLSPEDLASIQAMQAGAAPPGADAEQVQALWDHMGRLEERIAGMMPEFDRLTKELLDSRKGVKGLLSNWMEFEGKLGFYAEKRHVAQLEARIPPAGLVERLDGYDKRVADLEAAAIALQDGLHEIASVLTGAGDAGATDEMSWADLPDQ